MTAQELAAAARTAKAMRRSDYAPRDDADEFDTHGNAKDGNMFDNEHADNVFPY